MLFACIDSNDWVPSRSHACCPLQVKELLAQIPQLFAEQKALDSCLGGAVDACIQLLKSGTGGKLQVLATALPKASLQFFHDLCSCRMITCWCDLTALFGSMVTVCGLMLRSLNLSGGQGAPGAKGSGSAINWR